jgi:uncharacterized protein (DUF433 family)
VNEAEKQIAFRQESMPHWSHCLPDLSLPKRKIWAKPIASFDRIISNPNILNGQPPIRGMRLSVRRVIEALAAYPNWDDLRREYPELEPEDLRQALEFAARNLDDTVQPLEAV